MPGIGLNLRPKADVVKNADRIKREVRRMIYRVFTRAVGYAMLSMARKIPVVTGTTREAMRDILHTIELRNRQYGGHLRLARLSMRPTIRKVAPGHEPKPKDIYRQHYSRTIFWNKRDVTDDFIEGGELPGTPVESRGEWQIALMLEDITPKVKAMFIPGGGSFVGNLKFYYDIGVPYWKIYDEEGMDTRLGVIGPWHLAEYVGITFQKYWAPGERLIKNIATKVLMTDDIRGQITVFQEFESLELAQETEVPF
jgi:hypothetical protein